MNVNKHKEGLPVEFSNANTWSLPLGSIKCKSAKQTPLINGY